MSSRTDGRAAGRASKDNSKEHLSSNRHPKSKSKPPTSKSKQGESIQSSKPPAAQHPHLSLYQTMLDVFAAAFPDMLAPGNIESTLHPTLQAVKGCLYERDFDGAFGSEAKCRAYAVRWSASRALGYLDVLKEAIRVFEEGPRDPVQTISEQVADVDLAASETSKGSKANNLKILTLGGGAGAELVALAALTRLRPKSSALTTTQIDIANWSSVLSSLYTAATSPLTISPYASAALKAAAAIPLASPSSLSSTFHQIDVLEPSAVLAEELRSAEIVTLAFTLNELYATSVQRTQAFLMEVTRCARKGAILCVVDSAGSYSVVGLGKKGDPKTNYHENGGSEEKEDGKDEKGEKRYPMRWLLDHALLKLAPEMIAQGTGVETHAAVWELVQEDASRWFRLPSGSAGTLKYPIELENMRFQMAVYRRL